VLMGALVAVLLCAYTVAKVLRDALFLSEFGAMNLPYAYIAVAFASAAAVWLETRMGRRFTRVNTVRLSQIIAIAFTVLAALLLPVWSKGITVVFYLWTGSQALMLLPHFWGLALDVWDSRRARRLFPLLSGCGLLGGTLGGAMAGWGTGVIHRIGLIWILAVLLALGYGLTYWIQRRNPHRAAPPEAVLPASRWEILRKSKYLKILVAGLALSVIVSTLVDFQFKSFIAKQYPDSNDLTRFLGKFHAGLNALSLLFQFTAAGWLLHRFGLGPTSGLQPVTAGLFGFVSATSGGWWPIVGLRWVQGVVFQALGKSSAEIYYMAVRPHERRIIKPAVDTLVQRWSDALVGLMLVVILHLFRVPVNVIAIVTGIMAVIWLAVIVVLNRQFGRAFEKALTLRWSEPDLSSESLHTPGARRALIKGLQSSDERRVITALELSRYPRDAVLARAVMRCLEHPSPLVRRASLDAMRAMRVRVRGGSTERTIESFLEDPDDNVRRAAIQYLLELGPRPSEFARTLLQGQDPGLRQMVLDVLFDYPYVAQGAITGEWIAEHLKAGTAEDLILAARGLGVISGRVSWMGLRTLIAHENPEIRRAALASAARRPHRSLVDLLLPQVLDPAVSFEAREAL
ncbi:MAG TPA: Npt1/Npt2 family nucleotide transporter, partial [Candidatus Eisenbacteria bacterium]|nr:Npt1/Npt2 family nucleotide transporter [Candidatus Eisenbacteria bacterium]